MFRNKKKDVYIVSKLATNKDGERLYDVYSKKDITDARLGLTAFTEVSLDDLEKTKSVLGKLKHRNAVRDGSQNWIDLVLDDKVTRVDDQRPIEALSPSGSPEDKHQWILNSALRGGKDVITDALPHLNVDSLKLLVEAYATNILKKPLTYEALEIVQKDGSAENLRATVLNMLENGKHSIQRGSGVNYTMSRSFASMLAKKIVDVYRSRGVTSNLKMRAQDVKKYVEKILSKKNEMFSEVSMGGLNINSLLDEATHRNQPEIQNLLAGVLLDTIMDKTKHDIFTEGDDYKKLKTEDKTDYVKTLIEPNIDDIQKDVVKHLKGKNARLVAHGSSALLSKLQELSKNDEDFKALLARGFTKESLTKFIIEKIELKGLPLLQKRLNDEDGGKPIVDVSEIKDPKNAGISKSYFETIQTMFSVPERMDLYDYFSNPKQSSRLGDLVENLKEHGEAMDERAVLEALKGLKKTNYQKSQDLADGGFFDNLDVVKLLTKDKFYIENPPSFEKVEETVEQPVPVQDTQPAMEIESNRYPEQREQVNPPDDERIMLHEKQINRLALGPLKLGLESGDDLVLSDEQIEKEEKSWNKILQYIEPGYGLVEKGKRNVLYEGNLKREANKFKGPLLAVSSQQELPGNDIPSFFHGSKIRAEAKTANELVIDILKRELYQTTLELAKAKRGGSALPDVYNTDRTESNKTRPKGDVFEPIHTEGNKGHKRKMLPAYDKGETTQMRSVFDRRVDRRFIH